MIDTKTGSTTLVMKAILLDMDGTLIDSTAGVLGAWEYWGRKNPHLDIEDILRTSHGVRTVDNLRKWNPEISEDDLEARVNEFEMEIINASKRNEALGKAGIVLLPGVEDLLSELSDHSDWAICTSATTVYASAALESVKITVPKVFVTANDVAQGKPFPDPYLLGASRCNVDAKECLVIEDAPSGVASGKAAGCIVLAVCTSHSREQMQKTDADYIVDNLSSISITRTSKGLEVTINN